MDMQKVQKDCLVVPRNYRVRVVSLFVVITMVSTFLGYLLGVWQITGTSPFSLEKSRSILPPADPTEVTIEQVEEYLDVSKPEYTAYGEGFNCVESAILAARDASWAGMLVEIFRLVGTDSIDHMIIGFPTAEGAWIFVEPQTGSVVDIQVGKYYMGEEITEIYVLRLDWELFSDSSGGGL